MQARSAPVPSGPQAANELPVGRGTGGRWWLELLHIAGLSALSIAQPTYALIEANPQFLSAHAVDGWQLALLIAALSVLPPLVAAALEFLALAVGPRARAAVHSMLVGGLVAILVLQALTRLLPSSGGWWVLAVAAAAGVVSTRAYRSEAIYTLATFLSVSALVVPAAFVLDGRVRGFLAPAADPTLFDVEVGNRVPLVVVIFDELPLASLLDAQGLAIDATLFPSFSRLAATSHWFRNATTTGAFTELAVPSLHNGRYTSSDHLINADLESYPENLFTLLGSTYDLHALASAGTLAPRLGRRLPRALGLEQSIEQRPGDSGASLLLADVGAIVLQVVTPQPWRTRLPRIDVSWIGFWELRDGDDRGGGPASRSRELRDFVRAIHPTSRPPFVYAHPLFPHSPWDYLPSGRRYFDVDSELPARGDSWSDDEWLILQGYQRHRLQLVAADRLLGELLDRLEALQWLDDALVVVTADHGVAFVAGAPRREVGPEHEEVLRAAIMPIPLLVKLPRQHEAVIDDRKVEIIDVLPTIADVLDIELPWPVDGRSLLDRTAADRPGRRLQIKRPYVRLDLVDREHPSARDEALRLNGSFGKERRGRDRSLPRGAERRPHRAGSVAGAGLDQLASSGVAERELVPRHPARRPSHPRSHSGRDRAGRWHPRPPRAPRSASRSTGSSAPPLGST